MPPKKTPQQEEEEAEAAAEAEAEAVAQVQAAAAAAEVASIAEAEAKAAAEVEAEENAKAARRAVLIAKREAKEEEQKAAKLRMEHLKPTVRQLPIFIPAWRERLVRPHSVEEVATTKLRRDRHDREQTRMEFVLLHDRERVDSLRLDQRMDGARALSIRLKDKELRRAAAAEAAELSARLASRRIGLQGRVHGGATSSNLPKMRVVHKEYISEQPQSASIF